MKLILWVLLTVLCFQSSIVVAEDVPRRDFLTSLTGCLFTFSPLAKFQEESVTFSPSDLHIVPAAKDGLGLQLYLGYVIGGFIKQGSLTQAQAEKYFEAVRWQVWADIQKTAKNLADFSQFNIALALRHPYDLSTSSMRGEFRVVIGEGFVETSRGKERTIAGIEWLNASECLEQ